MSVDARAEVLIDRPRQEVAAYVADPANDRSWIRGIREAEPLTPLPVAVGTRVRRVASFLGRRMEYTLAVEEYVPGELLVMRTNVPFEMAVTYAFAARNGGTAASVRVQGEGSGFYRLAEPLLNRLVRRNLSRDLQVLKSLLEHTRVEVK